MSMAFSFQLLPIKAAQSWQELIGLDVALCFAAGRTLIPSINVFTI